MSNKTETLWDSGQETRSNLRLPKTPVNLGLSGNSGPPQASEQIAAKSVLSADAPEFYPADYLVRNRAGPVPSGSSIQDRLKKHRGAPEMGAHDEDDDFTNSPDDIRLRHLVSTLIKDPGQYEDLREIFMDTISPYFGNIVVLSKAAELLVSQAIMNPSFRYTAARLCCIIEMYCAEFRAELHLTCKKELEKNPQKSGLLLFVAELYIQLHHENIYGMFLIDAFKHLLALGGNDNVKSVCQALKLTGYSLDLYDRKALDEVFVKLDEVQGSVNGVALSLIESVKNLRNSQWGHGSPNAVSSSSEPESYYFNEDIQKAVFYGTDGSKLSKEESEFLAYNMNSTEEYFTDASDPDELCDPEPEMDEEIQAAFKDFVKLSKR